MASKAYKNQKNQHVTIFHSLLLSANLYENQFSSAVNQTNVPGNLFIINTGQNFAHVNKASFASCFGTVRRCLS